MGLLDFLLGDDSSSNNGRDYDRSVFDTDRFRNNGSGNWVDWEDVSTANYWKSPVCVTPEAQVPLTLESKFGMTPIKS